MSEDIVTYNRDGEVWLSPRLLEMCQSAEQRRQRERELRVLQDARLLVEMLTTRGRSWKLDQLLGDLLVLIEEREK